MGNLQVLPLTELGHLVSLLTSVSETKAEVKKAAVQAQPSAAKTTEAPAANTETREKKPFVKREKKEFSSEGGDGRRPGQKSKKKPCAFCMDKKGIDYKDANRLKKFMTEKGKILPARQTGVCARHQRELTTAIKVARNMALLPFKGE